MNNDVLLIRPRLEILDYGSVSPPLNLGYLAASLKKNNISVAIIDPIAHKFSQEDLLLKIKQLSPKIIGFSAFTPEVLAVYEDVNAIKNNFPDIKIVLGGPHPSALPELTLQENTNIDFIVVGEGEITLVELAKAIINNQNNFDGIPGIYYKNGNEIFHTLPRAVIKNIDEIDFPAYDLLDMDMYTYFQKEFSGLRAMNMFTSRGCPFLCTYCSHAVFGRAVRFRSIDNIMNEISILYNKYEIRTISFVDDCFTLKKNRVIEICDQLIKSNFKIKWSCFSNISTIDEPLLEKMKEAGCYKISFGVESGNQALLDVVRKNQNLSQIKEIIKMTKKSGIQTLAFFMIGLPGETKETIKQSKKFAKKINPDFISVSILCPLPGSDIFQEHRGDLSNNWSNYQLMPFEKLPTATVSSLSVEVLQHELKRFYRYFFLSPKYIFSCLKKVRSFGDLAFYFKKGFKVGKYWI
jgi:anaerobic magnesium-protoporphyrin IX monomethyl ester cyclase